jgi:hypothetical protein
MDSDIVAPADFKDRKTGLIVFGALTILMGCFCGLSVLLMIAAPMLAAKSASPPPPPPPHVTMFGAAMYGGMAIALIWLGIGSIMARRWARALLAIWSWSSLLFGVFAVVIMAIWVPRFNAAMSATQPPGQAPASAQFVVMLIIFLFSGIMFVLLPLLWALFYGGKNVKATCEALDPVVRWTDRCPLPVLAMSLWLGFGALTMLLGATIRNATPFFGMLLSGWPGTVFFVFLALLWSYSAWALYHLDRRGWWIIFSAMILFCISNVITYSRHDLGEVYALMGYSTEQIAAVQKLGFMGTGLMIWSSLITVPFLGYLWYIRKFLPSRPTDALTN